MSMHQPGELIHMSEFDRYNHAELADRVLWPLVNFAWRGDWREQSFVGNTLTVARRGAVDGELFDVVLNAYTEVDFDPGTEGDIHFMPLMDSVELTIARHVEDERKDMMLETATNYSEDEHDEDEEDDSEGYEEDFSDGFEESFQDPNLVEAKVISSYLIDADNELYVNTSQELVDLGTDEKWFYETDDYIPLEESLEATDEVTEVMVPRPRPGLLHETDIELIENGLIVFNTPRAIMQVFRKIKERGPIEQI